MTRRPRLPLLLLGGLLTGGLVLCVVAFAWGLWFSAPAFWTRGGEKSSLEDAVREDAPAAGPTAIALLARTGVLVIAHRGASSSAPENTLPAFRAGVESEADLVELDYRHSQDGHPVVLHDETLDRTSDAVARWSRTDIAVAGETLARLRTLDAGTWFDARFAGTRVPTLAEALDVILPGSIPLIERKAGDAAALVALLRRQDLVEQVVVQSFDWAFLAEVAQLEPGCVLAGLGSKPLSKERLDQLTSIGVRAIGWNKRDVSAALVTAAHERGLKVWVYTVDKVQRARALVAMGVDGIITNRPAEMRASLHQ